MKNLTRTLKVEGLSVAYGHQVRVSEVNLTLGPGELIGLTGPNGGGKTTFMKALAGIHNPSSGKIFWLDEKEGQTSPITLRDCWYSGAMGEAFEDLTLQENLDFMGEVLQLGLKERENRRERLFELWQLEDHRHKLVKDLSTGLKKRISLALGLMEPRPVILLDEPFNGLDAQGTEILVDVLSFLKSKGFYILVATHILTPLNSLASFWGWIEGGVWETDQGKILSFISTNSQKPPIQELPWIN